jgi:hypothetical protein
MRTRMIPLIGASLLVLAVGTVAYAATSDDDPTEPGAETEDATDEPVGDQLRVRDRDGSCGEDGVPARREGRDRTCDRSGPPEVARQQRDERRAEAAERDQSQIRERAQVRDPERSEDCDGDQRRERARVREQERSQQCDGACEGEGDQVRSRAGDQARSQDGDRVRGGQNGERVQRRQHQPRDE